MQSNLTIPRSHSGKIHRIALSTGGGDAPGLNAVIRAAVISAMNRGWERIGIRDDHMKRVPLDCGTIHTARDPGIGFGD